MADLRRAAFIVPISSAPTAPAFTYVPCPGALPFAPAAAPLLFPFGAAPGSAGSAVMSAHAIVTAARSGNGTAQDAVSAAVASARAGSPAGIAQAAILTTAQKLVIRAAYVDRWIHGIGG